MLSFVSTAKSIFTSSVRLSLSRESRHTSLSPGVHISVLVADNGRSDNVMVRLRIASSGRDILDRLCFWVYCDLRMEFAVGDGCVMP